MKGYGKGRTTGYTDYFKKSTSTPGGSFDDEEEGKEETSTKIKGLGSSLATKKSTEMEERKKAAIRRRLQNRKAGK